MFRTLSVLLLIGYALAEVPTIEIPGLKPGVAPKIIKGEDANEGEFPYMASLKRKINRPGHFCGGSILTPKWIMSAAHCCDNIRNINDHYVFTGSIYHSKGGSNHSIEKIFIHEEYDEDLYWINDICLLKLSKPITLDKNTQQITLPLQDWQVNSGDKVTISGWGYTVPEGTQVVPDRLQKGVNFIAYSNDECTKKVNIKMTKEYLCARGPTKETCTWNGDSGGPLVKNGVQVGLVSFGFRPYGLGMPTVYCRVPTYISWIKEKLGPDAKDLKFVK